MNLTYPRMIVRAKEPFAYSGNRLNGLFLSRVMGDNDTVRKIIHEQRPCAKEVLSTLFTYYNNRDKNEMLNKFKRLEEVYGAGLPFWVLRDKNGNECLFDWSSGHCGSVEESFWVDLSMYDEKFSVKIYDEWGRPRRHKNFENMSVIEVLEDTIHNRNCYIEKCPQTGNEKLDLLLSKLYGANSGEAVHEPTYYLAVKNMNEDLLAAFKGEKKVEARSYIPAIIMLENLSAPIFDAMGYREQFGFYHSELGQEMLKFSYMTTFSKISNFDENDMNSYLAKVKSSGLWQVAQYHITTKLAQNKASGSLLNQRLLSLNYIRERPKEKIYQGYYDTDIERMRFLNWYFPRSAR